VFTVHQLLTRATSRLYSIRVLWTFNGLQHCGEFRAEGNHALSARVPSKNSKQMYMMKAGNTASTTVAGTNAAGPEPIISRSGSSGRLRHQRQIPAGSDSAWANFCGAAKQPQSMRSIRHIVHSESAVQRPLKKSAHNSPSVEAFRKRLW
jgi:hypothetical protein